MLSQNSRAILHQMGGKQEKNHKTTSTCDASTARCCEVCKHPVIFGMRKENFKSQISVHCGLSESSYKNRASSVPTEEPGIQTKLEYNLQESNSSNYSWSAFCIILYLFFSQYSNLRVAV